MGDSTSTRALAARDSGLAPWRYKPRAARPDDVAILCCGVCHTVSRAIDHQPSIPNSR